MNIMKRDTLGILEENNSDISALVVSNKNHTTRFEISRPQGFRESTTDVIKIVFGLRPLRVVNLVKSVVTGHLEH